MIDSDHGASFRRGKRRRIMSDADQQLEATIEVYPRPMDGDQREAISRFYSALEEELESFQLGLEQILESERLYALCTQEGNVVGLAGLKRVSLMRVLFMVVEKQWQGKGFGKQLMSRLMSDVGDFRVLMLSVQRSNVAACGLYKRFGFRTVFRPGATAYMVYGNVAGVLMYPVILVALLVKSLFAGAD